MVVHLLTAAGVIASLACSVEAAYAQQTLVAYVSGNGTNAKLRRREAEEDWR